MGIAPIYVSTLDGAIRSVSEKKVGAATGLYLTIAWVGCAAGVAICGTLIAYKSEDYLDQKLQEKRIDLNYTQMLSLERAAKGVESMEALEAAIPQKDMREAKTIAKEGFTEGIHVNVWMFIVLAIFSLFLGSFIRKRVKNS